MSANDARATAAEVELNEMHVERIFAAAAAIMRFFDSRPIGTMCNPPPREGCRTSVRLSHKTMIFSWAACLAFTSCGLLLQSAAVAEDQISCAISPLYVIVPNGESTCSVALITSDDYKTPQTGNTPQDNPMMAFGMAFAPPDTKTYVALTGAIGRYGAVHLVTADPYHRLSVPHLREAIDAVASFSLFSKEPGMIFWRAKSSIDGFDVEFYTHQYPVASFGGGPRECMTFVRYLDGTPSDHTRRIVGYYCEVRPDPLTPEIASAFFKSIQFRPWLIR